ncbi:hypothetical protein RJ639_041058 [Escallonia herrerae]|uniref:RRM domain-containing protein n=1 Tax=Escallonia herrerae TaxID=1293975 RepID=A0AA89B7J7_9ASTE|nr:hypothetical protein RJ639_041058 [Escallonia herrerae]
MQEKTLILKSFELQELDVMRQRLKEMEDESLALREMQAKVEKEMGAASQDPATVAASQANKEEVDSRSVFVGNVRSLFPVHYMIDMVVENDLMFDDDRRVMLHSSSFMVAFFLAAKTETILFSQVDYSCTPEEVQQHFQSCGTVNRVTIRTNKFGQPKGYAYVEFLEPEAVQQALLLSESELHSRQLKVKNLFKLESSQVQNANALQPLLLRPRVLVDFGIS